MSLGAIDFGPIVDGAVVVIENVFRLTSQKRALGHRSTDLVREATAVARPVPQVAVRPREAGPMP